MDQKIIEIMKNLGFEEREIKIYLSLLKNNSQTALQISKDIRIDRTTTYDILERLIDKGIISITIKNKIKNFSVIKPKELLLLFKEKYSSLENILPELTKIFKKSEKTQVKCELFQGREGIRTVIKNFLENYKDYKVIGIRKEYEEIIGYLNDQGILKLDQSKIKEIALVEKGAKFKKLKHGIYKYLNKKMCSPITTMIHGEIIIFFIWKEPYFAIKIENKSFSKAQEEYFDILWKLAESKQ